MHRKTGAGDAVGRGRWIGGRSFEKSSHILVESPGKMAFLSVIQTDLSGAPIFHRRYDWMYSSHYVFGVAVDHISVCLKLEIASGVFPDWRGVSCWRRSCPYQP